MRRSYGRGRKGNMKREKVKVGIREGVRGSLVESGTAEADGEMSTAGWSLAPSWGVGRRGRRRGSGSGFETLPERQ